MATAAGSTQRRREERTGASDGMAAALPAADQRETEIVGGLKTPRGLFFQAMRDDLPDARGQDSGNSGASSRRIACMVSMEVSPWKARLPESSSWRITPKLKMSLR